MKKWFLFLANLLIINVLVFACDTTLIDKSTWSVVHVDSEELTGEGANNGHAIHCFDGDSTTFWHTEWQNVTSTYPHEISIDLGDTFAINGFSLLTRASSQNGRIKDYVFYISNDTNNWGSPQSIGQIVYPNPQSSEQQTGYVFFGTVSGRYIRLIANSSMENGNHAMVAELNVYQDTLCPPTGQNNQTIQVTEIPRQFTTNPPIVIDAVVSSGLPLEYEILSGPATISDNMITLTGEGGVVAVRISQAGDAAYYPISVDLSFTVTNLQDFNPIITSKLTSNFPIQMPRLMPYLIHTNVTIEEPDSLSLISVRYRVGNLDSAAVNVNGDYQFWWTPDSFGTHTIDIVATASNGNMISESITVEVTDQIEDRAVQTLEDAVIDVGTIGSQWYYGSYELPQSVGAFHEIEAYFDVTCPNVPGNCDDWDRIAWVQVKDPSGKWVELFRYITPYGVGCDHSIDVTDYESLLQGKLDFRVYIETWGTGGWKMDLIFNYAAGEPQYPYSHIEELWQGTYNFGDPANLQPMDTATVGIFHDVQKATLRLVTTGHGWGNNNTGNAAEFYHAVHDLKVNGEDAFVQDLWQICNPNPDGCTGQHGTWQYNRAGWCPGLIARPFSYDLSPYLWKTPFNLQYIFQTSYQDNCHPNNPDCVSGVTCSDCNDSYNPHYRISAYVIRFSGNPLEETVNIHNYVQKNEGNIDFELYPNPSNGQFRLDFKNEMKEELVCAVIGINGQSLKTFFFKNSNEAENKLFDISSFSKGVYFLQIYTEKGMNAQKIILQ